MLPGAAAEISKKKQGESSKRINPSQPDGVDCKGNPQFALVNL